MPKVIIYVAFGFVTQNRLFIMISYEVDTK